MPLQHEARRYASGVNHSDSQSLARIVSQFATLPEVCAIALAGSRATGYAAKGSDFDVYVYTNRPLSGAQRLAVGRELSSDAQLIDSWGPALAWDDPLTGALIEAMFFETPWIEDLLDKVLFRHEASLGYSTCFWHTIRVSQPLHDPTGWFAELQRKAVSPYPEPLRQNIVAHNLSAICRSTASYETQIAKALARNDWVSVNHRIAALLASAFDIVFAHNRQTHPGEKRLLLHVEQSCPLRPDNFEGLVLALVHASDQNTAAIQSAVDALVDALAKLFEPEGIGN